MSSNYLFVTPDVTQEQIEVIADSLSLTSYQVFTNISPRYQDYNVSSLNNGWFGSGNAPAGATVLITEKLLQQAWVWIREEEVFEPEMIIKTIAIPLAGSPTANYIGLSSSTWKSLGFYSMAHNETLPKYIKAVVDPAGSTLEVRVWNTTTPGVLWSKTVTGASVTSVSLDKIASDVHMPGVWEIQAKRSAGLTTSKIYSMKMEIV